MMVGIHLHDVRGLEDHLAPGQGEADLKEVISMLKTHHIKILEINTRRTDRQELIKGIEFCNE
jgi:sugar phosphate isomerase/epimerase